VLLVDEASYETLSAIWLLGGYAEASYMVDLSSGGYYWGSTSGYDTSRKAYPVIYTPGAVVANVSMDKYHGMQVRCVK
jgi:hypothetical protein